MKAFATRFDNNDRQRETEMEQRRKMIAARIEKRQGSGYAQKPVPNGADVKKLLSDQAKAQARQQAADAKLKQGERVTAGDLASLKSQLNGATTTP